MQTWWWGCSSTVATSWAVAQTINRLHEVEVGTVAGRAKQFLSAREARPLVATTKPRDLVGRTRRRLVVELIGELEGIDKKIKTADRTSKNS